MLGLHPIDLLVMFAYFLVVLYIGWRAMQKIKGQEDFFLGGRSFNKFFQTFSMFGQATSAESAVNTSAIVGARGSAGGMMIVFSGLLTLPFYWFIPLWLRRTRLMTLADMFVERFRSHRLAVLYATAQCALFLMVGGMGLYAMSQTVTAIAQKPVEALTVEEQAEYEQALRLEELEARPTALLTEEQLDELETLRQLNPRQAFSYINRDILIFCMAVFILLYTAGGGLEAAVYTDAMQSIFILILTGLLLPFSMVRLNQLSGETGFLGPFRALHETLPAAFMEIMGSPQLGDFTWHGILLLSFISMAGALSYSNNLTVCGAAKDEQAARYGNIFGLTLKRFSTVFWVLLGLFILAIYGAEQNPDMLWGMATRDLLPVGLTGLMIACLLAALMSSADTHMLVVSALITQNLYKPLVRGRSESHYLTMGRLLGIVYIAGAVLVAMRAQSLLGMFRYMLMINVTTGPTILMVFLWRRTNRLGAWVSMGVSILLTIVIPLFAGLLPGVRTNPALLTEITPPAEVRTYTATIGEVDIRAQEITEWDLLAEAGAAEGERPVRLAEGDLFEETYQPPTRPIFWGNIEVRDGVRHGTGMFRAELYLLSRLGVDLASNHPSTNSSLVLIFRLLFPFAAIFLVGMLTKPDPQDALDQWYGKLLTPVEPDAEADARAIAQTKADPNRQNHLKLWPESSWQIRRWTREDWFGFAISIPAMIGSIGLFWLFVRIGR